MEKKEIEKEVNNYESIDRYVTKQVLGEMFTEFNHHNFKVVNLPILCHADLSGTTSIFSDTIEYFAEVKENTTNERYLPARAIIKKKKVEDIAVLGAGKQQYFISLLDKKTAYLFWLNDIDWDNTKLINMRQRKTQVDDDSEMVYEWTYLIDYDKAVWSCDITKYYKKYYADYKKTKEEEELPEA